MKKNKTFTQFIIGTLLAFSFILLFLMVIGPIIGDDAKGTSALFSLGTKGIAFNVMLQALGIAILVNIVQALFLSNLLFKKMMLLWRTIWIFVSTFIIGGIWGIAFGWFPADKPIAWLSYLISFGLAMLLSVLIMLLKTRRENTQVNQKLQEYRKQKENSFH